MIVSNLTVTWAYARDVQLAARTWKFREEMRVASADILIVEELQMEPSWQDEV